MRSLFAQVGICAALVSACAVGPAVPIDLQSVPVDLEIPAVTDDAPAAGMRVRVSWPEYAETEVHHLLYLPVDWTPGGALVDAATSSALEGAEDGSADRLQHPEPNNRAWSVGVLRDRELNHALMATLQLLGDPCTNAGLTLGR